MQTKKPVEPLTDQADVSTGSAADVEAVMRKYDRESNTRIWTGKPKLVVNCVLAAFSLFCIYVTLFGNFLEHTRMTSFMGLVIVMGFLTYPARKGHVQPNHIPWYDIALMLLGSGAFMYYAVNADAILNTELSVRLTQPHYTIIAVAGVLVLAELCRRSVGLPILVVAVVFIGYTFITGKGLARTAYEMFYGDNGILGTPVNVCSKYIVVFIIFGAFLERTGVSTFFINLANSLTGRYAGGPAKVAVISSALCGMVSGSSVGNTVTTGSMTIPMMKKTGYRAEFAGAVEAAASTGGQIMPPIMGAAAFLMADYLGVSYSNIIVRAIVPAVLYFLGIFIAVHLEAKKLGLKGIDRSLLPRMKDLMKDSYLLLPLIVLIYLVCSNTRTMQFSAAVSILVAILVGVIGNVARYLRATKREGSLAAAAIGKDGGFSAGSVFDALSSGGRSCITVAVACGIAGCIAGCITLTGLATNLINSIVSVSSSSMILALLLTMLCCIVLGMGVPTTATYCIMASTCAPILMKMGVPDIAAHFFVFYYGIVADITPPVALAAYAGAAIAKGSPMKTGVTATRLAIGAFIIPFVFAASPALLFIDTVWYEVVLIVITATIGMMGIAAGLSGYLLTDMNLVERLLTIGGGVLLIIPGILTDVLGISIIAIAVLLQLRKRSGASGNATRRVGFDIAIAVLSLAVLGVVGYTQFIQPANNYKAAVEILESGDYEGAISAFEALGNYRDSKDRVAEAHYQHALALIEAGEYDAAEAQFKLAGNHGDAAEQLNASLYRRAEAMLEAGEFEEAKKMFGKLGDYSDAAARGQEAMYRFGESLLAKGDYKNAATKFNAAKDYEDGARRSSECRYLYGMQLLEAGDYVEAEKAFDKAGRYEDAQDMVLECRYRRAAELVENEKYEDAYAIYAEITDYKDVADILKGNESLAALSGK